MKSGVLRIGVIGRIQANQELYPPPHPPDPLSVEMAPCLSDISLCLFEVL